MSLFLSVPKRLERIKRKSLLYKTKVEYGEWTINHILGCRHGCKFPCYAYMLSKKFGRVKDYQEWIRPKIVENSLELLDREISIYKDKMNIVHLSFMTDPFMYEPEIDDLIPEVKELTLKIIKKLNENNIKVTTLTKGFYPKELLDQTKFLPKNEYGITLVSLNPDFKSRFEPFSASYKKRLESLKMLHDAGLKTWVSIEPYPTPNLDPTALEIEKLLQEISFVDKIIFGKMNYNIKSSHFENNEIFYARITEKVISFCEKNNIRYHIKFGTPGSTEQTKDLFSNNS